MADHLERTIPPTVGVELEPCRRRIPSFKTVSDYSPQLSPTKSVRLSLPGDGVELVTDGEISDENDDDADDDCFAADNKVKAERIPAPTCLPPICLQPVIIVSLLATAQLSGKKESPVPR